MSARPHRKPRVVIVDEELPYPAETGKRIRSWNLTRRLARNFSITYVAHRSQTREETMAAEACLLDHGVEACVVDRPISPNRGLGFYAKLGANLLSPLPYSVQRHATREMQAEVRRLNAEGSVDLWQVEWTPYAQNLESRGTAPRVVMAHNIESQIWQRYFESEENPLKRWYIGRQYAKFLKFEREAFQRASRVVVVSDPDADLARRLYGMKEVEVVSNGVDVDYFHPSSTHREPKTILFLGALLWRPNLDAIRLLLREIFPRVLAAEPDARLQIVGRDPPAWLVKEVADVRNATLHPNVPDVRPFLWKSAVMAVPLRIGGGSRLKILEALACACPVVSTRIGSEGLDLTPGQHYIATDSPADMAPAILQAFREPREANEQASRGRARILEKYSWDPLAEELGAVWESQLARRPGPGLVSPPAIACGSRTCDENLG